MNVHRTAVAFVAACVLLLPVMARAQATGSIAGLVKDTSGAVLPGATVEAASPALIEKVRTVVTDAQGNYKIVDLRPGAYTVTVTLPGFSTFKREGIDLSAGFTATVNADLKVGSLEETVTVTGASPIVDTQNARTQQVLKTETMNQLPSGSRSLMSVASMTLGAMPSSPGRNDVGGDKGENSTGIILHGGRGDDGRTNWDGMSTNVFFGGSGGQQRTYYFNTVAVQEVVVDTGGATAETETGGANLNIVPREGGNELKLYGTANYTNSKFSAEGVPDSLQARGVSDQSSLKKIYDYGVGAGGPLSKDRAWFYASNRWWGAQNYGLNNYRDADSNPATYTFDTSRPVYGDSFFVDSSFRATIQLSAKHKLNHEIHLQHGCTCRQQIVAGALNSAEADQDYLYGPQVLNQTTWSFTASNRLLVQAGASFLRQEVNFVTSAADNVNYFTGVAHGTFPNASQISVQDVVGTGPGGIPAGYRYNAADGGLFSYGPDDDSNNFNQRLAVSYITGSHAIKVGLQTLQGHYDFQGMANDVPMVSYTFAGGQPISLAQFAGPFMSKMRLNGQGIFAQDQWTVKKLTLSGGVRFDHFQGRTLALDIPAGPLRPAYSVPEDPDLPNFSDFSYRLGASYDLFGNGRTAIKATLGKYLVGLGGSLSQQGFAPAVQLVASANRPWFGGAGAVNPATGAIGDGDFVADCALTNLAANGECGPIDNPAFGQPAAFQHLADDVRKGWGNRTYNYQWNVQLQHELRPGLGLAVGYFHTQWANMSVAVAQGVTPADYTEYSITAPNDPGLGATAGQAIGGFYDLLPGKFPTGILITQASHYGEPEDFFNGMDIGLNARWGKGAFLSGGVSVGREVTDFCYANGHPELVPEQFNLYPYSATLPFFRYSRSAAFCRITPSWWSGIGSQAKVQVVYPLPYDITVSASYKNLPGIPRSSDLFLTNPQVSALLGRPSTNPAGFGLHSLVPYQSLASATVFDDRLNQTDVRFSKGLKVGRGRIQGLLDVYNLFNARTPQAVSGTYGGPSFTPTALLGGRLFKFGVQVDW